MRILAIDTALGACSVAITDAEAVLARLSNKRLRGHAEQLMPMVEKALNDAGLEYSDLDLLAVTVGPGTFTGLRIGLAAIRAIAIASAIPAQGVTTLQILAAAAMEKEKSETPLYVAIDGRRQECFVQKFDISDGAGPRPLNEARSIPLIEIAAYLGHKPAYIVGSGVELIARHMDFVAGPISPVALDPDPDPVLIAREAEIAFKTRPPKGPPEPVYLRAPDAKLPGGKLPETG